MSSATGQIGKAVLSKLAKRTAKGAKKAVGRKAAMGKAKIAVKGAIKKGVKSAANGVGVVAGSNVRKAKAVVSATTGKTKTAAVKNLAKQKSKTAVARVAVGAGVAGAATAANAKVNKKTGNKYVSKAKSTASTAKRKVQAGYKMVYGKLKRVGRGG